MELHGKGSRKLRKALGTKLKVRNGLELNITRSNKYLGVHVGGGDESTHMEISQRIRSAGEAVSRLGKFWKVNGMKEKTKVRAYCQLVRTILLYGMETRVLSKSQLMRLEGFQTRVLRRIGKSQSHVTHESNESLRTRLEVHSVDSYLCRTRIRMWQKMFASPIDSVQAAVLGKIQGGSTWGSGPHTQQLILDVKELAERGGPNITAQKGKNGKLITDTTESGKLATLTKTETNKILSYQSRCENRKPTTYGPLNEEVHVCNEPGCDAKFSTFHRLTTHRVRTHGYRDNYRKLVVDNVCPMCEVPFASKHGAQNHIQKVCGKKGTEEERAAKVAAILRRRSLAQGLPVQLSALFCA